MECLVLLQKRISRTAVAVTLPFLNLSCMQNFLYVFFLLFSEINFSGWLCGGVSNPKVVMAGASILTTFVADENSTSTIAGNNSSIVLLDYN